MTKLGSPLQMGSGKPVQRKPIPKQPVTTKGHHTVLVDGDIVAFQASAATDGRQYTLSNGESFKYHKDAKKRALELDATFEVSFVPEPLQHSLWLVKKKMNDIKVNLEKMGVAGDTKVYLSSGGSYREKICPTYKANREGMRRPANLQGCKDYLLDECDAIVRPGEYEADDLIIMEAHSLTLSGDSIPVIATIDKDLRQYPTWFYNFDKKKLDNISAWNARKNFYSQLLTGDPTDGIVGIKGVGPKTAEKLLCNIDSEFDMYVVVLGEWLKRSPREVGESEELYLARILHTVRTAGQLLYLSRSEGDIWEAPLEPSK